MQTDAVRRLLPQPPSAGADVTVSQRGADLYMADLSAAVQRSGRCDGAKPDGRERAQELEACCFSRPPRTAESADRD
jgi:hypothetical protein